MAVGTFPQAVVVSTSLTLGATHKNRVVDATGGTGGGITLTVPAASGMADGELFYVRKADASTDDSVTLDGAFDYVLVNQDQYIAIVTNATAWRILWHN